MPTENRSSSIADEIELHNLREQLQECADDRASLIGKVEALRTQLAERDALLREFLEVATGGFSDSDHVLRVRRHLEAFLSASAEPSNTAANTRDAGSVKAAPIMLAAVANLVDAGDGRLEPRWLLEGGTAELFPDTLLLVADKPDLCRLDGSAVVYAGADFDEIERLRAMLRKIAGYHWANVDPEERARTRAELRDLLANSAATSAHGISQATLDGSATPAESKS